MPTPEQIAAQVRRRPIGAIPGDICRDLGIMPRDPLWSAISGAVIEFGGDYPALLGRMINQALAIMKDEQRTLTPVMPQAASSTGPPRHAAA
jgi:hypothetical protein